MKIYEVFPHLTQYCICVVCTKKLQLLWNGCQKVDNGCTAVQPLCSKNAML